MADYNCWHPPASTSPLYSPQRERRKDPYSFALACFNANIWYLTLILYRPIKTCHLNRCLYLLYSPKEVWSYLVFQHDMLWYTCTSLRHPVYYRWFYILRTGIPWVILWLNGRFSFTHSSIPPYYSPKKRIPGGPHNFIMRWFVTGLKYLMYFQWRYIHIQRNGTPLFKSNRHYFCNVKRCYIMSLYRSKIFHFAW